MFRSCRQIPNKSQKQWLKFLMRNYFLGVLVGAAIISSRVYSSRNESSSRSPVKLEDYKHYRHK